MSQTSSAYICPRCRHKVIRQTFGIENGLHETWWACLSDEETHFYGLPHREKDWEFTQFAAENPNLEPWPEEQPLKGMVAGQIQDAARDQVKTYIVEAIPAAVIAASLLIALWISLLSPVTA